MNSHVNDISKIWLGTWGLGGQGFGFIDEKTALRTLDCAWDFGIQSIDSAFFYAQGGSERLISKWLRGKKRDSVFLSSKGGLCWSNHRVLHDASEVGLRKALENTLKTLKIEYLDIFQIHWPDPKVSVWKSVEVLRAFQREGKITHWGICNFNDSQIKEALNSGEKVFHQVHFNLLNKNKKTLNHSQTYPIAYSPLEQGFLTGKNLQSLGSRDVRHRNPVFNSFKASQWVSQFSLLCKQANISPAVFSIIWILSHPEIKAVIIGPRSQNQLQELIQFRQWTDQWLESTKETDQGSMLDQRGVFLTRLRNAFGDPLIDWVERENEQQQFTA